MAVTRPVLIVAGGDPPAPGLLADIDPVAVFAVDRGLDTCRSLGLAVDRVIGDLDSVSDAALDWARGEGIPIEEHPRDKDQTDLELALDRAASAGAEQVVVTGVGGGRLDHLLANLLLLASARYAGLRVEARFGPERVVIVRPGGFELATDVGRLVSLLPLGGPAVGVRTEGLRWALTGETLAPGEPRGVSNESTAERIGIELEAGCLAVIVD